MSNLVIFSMPDPCCQAKSRTPCALPCCVGVVVQRMSMPLIGSPLVYPPFCHGQILIDLAWLPCIQIGKWRTFLAVGQFQRVIFYRQAFTIFMASFLDHSLPAIFSNFRPSHSEKGDHCDAVTLETLQPTHRSSGATSWRLGRMASIS